MKQDRAIIALTCNLLFPPRGSGQVRHRSGLLALVHPTHRAFPITPRASQWHSAVFVPITAAGGGSFPLPSLKRCLLSIPTNV